MDRSQLQELYYIAPIANLQSVLQHGILSHRRADTVPHDSVAMAVIQERRKNKPVPGGKCTLHDYANLYFCARNPMLFALQTKHEELCVVGINLDVLDLPNVVLTDRNASSDYVLFAPSPSGLSYLDHSLIFAHYWTDANPIRYYEKKSVKCAEVLVPDFVEVKYVRGAYVSCEEAAQAVRDICEGQLDVTIDANMFFV